MATLPKQINDKFLDELSQSDEVTEAQVKALRELMERGSKPKVAELETIFAPPKETPL